MAKGKPIYFNNVTVCEIIKRGKTIIEKELFSMETPSTSTTVQEFLDNDVDMSFIASRCIGKGMITAEKIVHFKQNFRIKRIDVGKILGYQSINTKRVDPDEYY